MWIDREGIAQTVSCPDPGLILGTSALNFVSGLSRRQRRRLEARLESLEEAIYGELDSLPAQPADVTLIGALPAAPLLAEVGSLDDLLAQLSDVDWWWKLDVIAALEELL